MSSFHNDDLGKINILFTSQESQVLINLTEQLIELLGGQSVLHSHSQEVWGHDDDPLLRLLGVTGSDAPPDDPVLRRLLPNAYADEESAGEFRRYTEDSLRQKKRAHAMAIYEALMPDDEIWSADKPIDRGSIEVSLNTDEIMVWLGGLNDLRLALAVRLGIGENSPNVKAERQKFELMKESDPMKAVYAVYSWLGWLQQSLLDQLN